MKKIISYYFIGMFLISSTILPLGDLSLMNDLPGMYQQYKKLANPKEISIVDFVGDYILAGKVLLGHNRHDKPETPSNNVQFQHSPISISFLFKLYYVPGLKVKHLSISYARFKNRDNVIEFHPELFRPPLA